MGVEGKFRAAAWVATVKKKNVVKEDNCCEQHLSITTLSNEGQIIRYDTDRAFAWHGCFLIVKGTIVQWSFVWKALLLCAIATGLGFARCKIPADGAAASAPHRRHLFGDAGPVVDDSYDLHWGFCLPPSFLADQSLLSFSYLVSFFLGTFVTNCFKRWWETRTYLQKIMSLTNELAMLSVAYIKSPKKDEETLAYKVREELIRYLNLTHALVYQQARDEHDLDQLKSSGLINEKERLILEHSYYRTHVVLGWASDLLTRAMERGLVFNVGGNTGMRLMQDDICRIRSSASDIFMYLDTQIPYGYVYLMTALTRIHLILMTIYAGGIIAKGFDNKSIYKLIFGYSWLTFNIFIYEGILRFAYELENPFGYDRQDFPAAVFKQKIVKTSAELIANDVTPITWLHGTCSADAVPFIEGGKGGDDRATPVTKAPAAVEMVATAFAKVAKSPAKPEEAVGAGAGTGTGAGAGTSAAASDVAHAPTAL